MPKRGRGYYDWRNPREAVVNGKLGTYAPNGTFCEYEEKYQTPNPRRYPQRHKNKKLDNEYPGDTPNDWTYVGYRGRKFGPQSQPSRTSNNDQRPSPTIPQNSQQIRQLNIPENSPPMQKDPTIVKINSPVVSRINKIPPLEPDLERAIAAIISKSPRQNKLPVGELSNTLSSLGVPQELLHPFIYRHQSPSKVLCVTLQFKFPSINISIPEKIGSPTQRAPPYLNTETSEIEEALAEWSPQPQQETQQDELENLFSKIQNPQAYLSINISPLPLGNQTGLNTDEIPNKDCSLEQLIQKLRSLISSKSPNLAEAHSLLDYMEATVYANKLSEVAIHPSPPKTSSKVQFPNNHKVPLQSESSPSKQRVDHPPQQKMSARLPSIIIRHSDPSSQEELSSIMVDALPAPKARISDLKQTRNKDLLVTFNSDQDKSLFREEIRELHQIKEKIVLTEPSKRNPSAIIFNIPKSFTETSIQQGLRQIFPQDLKVKFIFKGRDPDVQNCVYEVPA
ncbi:hypothetical protein AVEN_40606-1 [Araneus ventricosus]|uniref:Uncharacterized protein n=1 Tax=Araneus ventricosus TaxID=182803 RepID=A0A4Y2JAR1_ARAVE|nr:hypothetical protein AVEN_40606-1 [Araneus ventricosus]